MSGRRPGVRATTDAVCRGGTVVLVGLDVDAVVVEGFVDFEAQLADVDEAFRRAMGAETIKGVLTL